MRAGRTRLILRYFCLLSLAVVLAACEAAPTLHPTVDRGAIDLTHWDFQQDGAVKLNGMWAYFPGQLLTNAPASSEPQDMIAVPGTWGDEASPSGARRGFGHATYVLTVHLPEGAPRLGIEVKTISSAYALYVDGQLLAGVGTVGTSRSTSSPDHLPQIVALPAGGNRLHIAIQISNYQHPRGGLWDTVSIGSLDDLRQGREFRIAMAIFLTSAILMIGFYHLMLWALRRSDLSSLIFALICLSLSVRILTTNDIYIHTLLGGMPYGLLVRLEYLSMTATFLFSWLFIRAVFPQEVSRRTAMLFVAPSTLYALIITAGPLYLFTDMLIYMQALILLGMILSPVLVLRAAMRGREGAAAYEISLIALAVLVIYDLRVSLFPGAPAIQLFGADVLLLPLGTFAFVLTQAGVLAKRATTAMTQLRIRGEELAEAHRQLDRHAQELEQAVVERTAELEEANRQLSRLSLVDGLTQLANRRAFDRDLKQYWADHRRRQSPLAVIMIDVDSFKRFNDRYGHLSGDEALKAVAGAVARAANRPRDLVARYGGEELAILLADTDLDGAVHVAEHVRDAVAALGEPHADSEFGIVTISAGVASKIPQPESDPTQLIGDADAALYRAKANGRNRVEC